MFIVSLDPGGNTGVAMGVLTFDDWQAILQYRILTTVDDPYTALGFVTANKNTAVIMERRAAVPSSQQGLAPFETIYTRLRKLQWKPQVGFVLEPNKIVQVGPGQWKPFMQAQALPRNRGKWRPHTQHERDAMDLMHYVVQLNHLGKEVVYV